MAELKEACEELGLTDVATYLQSGNVVFHCQSRSAAKVAKMLEQQIESRFGFDVTVLVRTPGELQRVIASNPYATQAKKDPAKVHVTFLASRPSAAMAAGFFDGDCG